MSEIKGEISGLNDRMENLIVIIFFVLNDNRTRAESIFHSGEKRLFNISSLSCATNLLALSRRSGCIFFASFSTPAVPLPPSAPCLNSRVALH